MKKTYPVLQRCRLFTGISEADMKILLDCLSARQKHYRKNSFIFLAGEKMDSVGIVLSGAVHVLREDFWGRRKIMARVEGGGLFGEAFACADVEKIPVSVMAAEESDVLFINSRLIYTSCRAACSFHSAVMKNLSLLLAENNMALMQKLEYITQPTTREKLLSYLSEQARLAGKSAFDIPFNREELADYLSVERSAMSAELSKMQGDGLLSYHKNHFELMNSEQ
ncbi:MAG: Crp/Fnr family transcriptional regulator [Treponema sp.]|nr:Crp/Fnr family transcriptional regulator [Treponema sp.]